MFAYLVDALRAEYDRILHVRHRHRSMQSFKAQPHEMHHLKKAETFKGLFSTGKRVIWQAFIIAMCRSTHGETQRHGRT
jgi:hypothetical protein